MWAQSSRYFRSPLYYWVKPTRSQTHRTVNSQKSEILCKQLCHCIYGPCGKLPIALVTRFIWTYKSTSFWLFCLLISWSNQSGFPSTPGSLSGVWIIELLSFLDMAQICLIVSKYACETRYGIEHSRPMLLRVNGWSWNSFRHLDGLS